MSIHLEDDDDNTVEFNGKTFTFTLMLEKNNKFFLFSSLTGYDRFKNYSYCVGGRNHSATIKIKPAFHFNKKYSKAD